jgi:hypothetical protein
MLLSLDLRPVVASLVELATAPGCCASPWSLTPSPTAARPWLPGGVGGSWVLVVEAARHAAAQLQPVLLELPHACLLVPGRAVCPALGPGGRWTPWHATRPPGASGGANEVGPFWIRLPSGLGSGAGLVGGVLAACGRACQHRPARSLHPGRGGRTRLPPRELLAARPRLSRSGSRPLASAALGCAGLGAGTAPRRGCGAGRRCGHR